MKNISPARRASFEVLLKVEKERAFSSVLLPLVEENLTARDRALCHELTLGVLRQKLYLDKIIENLTKKKIGKFDAEVATSLRLGLYQLLFLDRVPAYSVINESVNLVKAAKKRSASGLVNAVLRKAAQPEKMFSIEFNDDIERLSVETSHPLWLLKRWSRQFGWPVAAELAAANNIAPGNAFRLTARFYRQSDEKKREIMELIETVKPIKSDLVPDCFFVQSSVESLRELAEAGQIYFQDESSQLVSKIIELKQNESFLDVCAAPGSKVTGVLADRWRMGKVEKGRQGARETGRRGDGQIRITNHELRKKQSKIQNPKSKIEMVVAGDYYEHRVRVLRDNCLNQGAEFISILRYDALRDLPFTPETFDAVLVDAPCSGTGTIRHNPEIRYFLEEKDFVDLCRKQLKILRNASNLVKRGGRLIYSTCSLEVQENEDVIGAFMGSEKGFEKVLPAVPDKFITTDGFARTYPHRDSADGFFISILEKK